MRKEQNLQQQFQNEQKNNSIKLQKQYQLISTPLQQHTEMSPRLQIQQPTVQNVFIQEYQTLQHSNIVIQIEDEISDEIKYENSQKFFINFSIAISILIIITFIIRTTVLGIINEIHKSAGGALGALATSNILWMASIGIAIYSLKRKNEKFQSLYQVTMVFSLIFELIGTVLVIVVAIIVNQNIFLLLISSILNLIIMIYQMGNMRRNRFLLLKMQFQCLPRYRRQGK